MRIDTKGMKENKSTLTPIKMTSARKILMVGVALLRQNHSRDGIRSKRTNWAALARPVGTRRTKQVVISLTTDDFFTA